MLMDDGESPDETAMTAAVAAAERRAGKRHRSVLLVGKVRRDAAEAACLVHDISRHGLMARFATPPAVGETLWIEVRGLPPVLGTVRWVRDRKAGVQFAEAQAVEHVFQPRSEEGLVARPPRFPLEAAVSLRFEGERFRAAAVDVSAGGLKLAAEHAVQTGQTGQATLVETGTALFGRVCWARDGQFGFRFCAPLPLETLARLLER